MTFKYDPNFDYYELFEMCLGDGSLFADSFSASALACCFAIAV